MKDFKMKVVISLLLILSLSGCDAWFGKIQSIGESAKITCYSGERIVYEGRSTGKVNSEESSDGYFFKDKKTGKFMEVSGTCIIIYG